MGRNAVGAILAARRQTRTCVPAYAGRVEILLWLVVPLAVTALAMVWAAWAGRPRDERGRDERSRERFATAMAARKPRRPLMVATQQRERSSGVAVRPSRRGEDAR